MDDLEYHGPCSHCGSDLWIIRRDQIRRDCQHTVHGFELPEGLGRLAVGDDTGWTACPVCGWAIVGERASPN